jgi:hypothetical protein
MGALATAPLPLFRGGEAARHDERGPERIGGGGSTLEQRLDGVLGAVREAGTAECPVCREPMTRRGPRAACRSCGSTLE